MRSENIRDAIRRIVKSSPDGVQSGALGRALGITRQALHPHLTALVAAGDLAREGAGRGARYRWARTGGATRARYATAGLAEDRVWRARRDDRAARGADRGRGERVPLRGHRFVNNAIDHAQSADVEIVVTQESERLRVEVIDEGIGIFDHVRVSRSAWRRTSRRSRSCRRGR